MIKPIADTPRAVDGLSCLLPERAGGMVPGLEMFCADRTLVLMWHGGYHQAKFIIIEQPPFDFILSDEPHARLDPAARLVPEAMVEAMLEPASVDLRNWIWAIRQLGPSAPGRIIVAATPPPKANIAFVQHHVGLEFGPDTISKLTAGARQYAVCNPVVLCKIWKLLMRMNKAAANAVGAEFLPVPPQSQDDDGCLKEEYYGNDVTHANAAWGALFLSHLNAYLDRTGEARAQPI